MLATVTGAAGVANYRARITGRYRAHRRAAARFGAAQREFRYSQRDTPARCPAVS
jgi:hypothetical protein